MFRVAVVVGYLAGLPVAALVIGQAVPEPYGAVAQYGIAGVLGVLLIRRYESELSREREARARAEAQADALSDRAMAEFVPLVTEVSRTMVPTLERLVSEVQRMGDRLNRPGTG